MKIDETEACSNKAWLSRSSPQGSHRNPSQGFSSPADITVLIVDDDPVNLELAKQCMQLANYRVLTATSGEQAVKAALTCRPDIVLMDIQMPVMNGCEAALLIRKAPEIQHTIGIIAVTALAMASEETWIETFGFDGQVTKPYILEDLLGQISTLLARR